MALKQADVKERHEHLQQADVKERHEQLHRSLDELIACFIEETENLPSKTTLMEFMEWSHSMTKNPTCKEKHK